MTTHSPNYEEQTKAAFKAYEAANSRKPQDKDWGLLTTDDGGGSPAPSLRLFAWFETREQLLDFIASDLILSASEPPEEREAAAALAQAAEAVAKVRSGAMDLGDIVQTFAGLPHLSQTLDWVGSFEELCTGAGPVPSEVREQFWWSYNEDDEDGDDTPPPIGEDEREDFMEFVQGFGT